MKILITEEQLKDGVVTYFKDDRITVDDEKGKMFVSLGWAKNIETGENNKRTPGAVTLTTDSIIQKS